MIPKKQFWLHSCILPNFNLQSSLISTQKAYVDHIQQMTTSFSLLLEAKNPLPPFSSNLKISLSLSLLLDSIFFIFLFLMTGCLITALGTCSFHRVDGHDFLNLYPNSKFKKTSKLKLDSCKNKKNNQTREMGILKILLKYKFTKSRLEETMVFSFDN